MELRQAAAGDIIFGDGIFEITDGFLLADPAQDCADQFFAEPFAVDIMT